jgi:predicted dehydrogenase
VTSTKGRLAAVADEFAIARRTRSFDELLGMDDIDIVDICTPAGLHFEQILAPLSTGKVKRRKRQESNLPRTPGALQRV